MENSFVLVFVIGLLSLSNFPKSSIAADTITPNGSITHPETIISAGGRFELGFFSPKNSTNHYVGIGYREVSPQAVVWVANREYPILSSSASLSIGSDGNIIIFDGKMHYFVTNTSSSNTTNATLLDSGNLILINHNSQVLWQSFDYPTDTLLLGMKLGYDHVTGVSWSLVSWNSSLDPAPGVFSLALALGPQLKREQLNIAVCTEKSNYVTWADDLGNSTISRIVLDVSGQLKLQSWSRTDGVQEWHTVQVSTCGRSGCGAFSICNKTAQMPCGCLPGFKSESNDSWAQEPGDIWAVHARRCVRKAGLGCNSSSLSKKDRFLRINYTDLPINPLKLDVRSSMECESASLSNCSWIAYSFDEGTGSCFVRDNDLLDLKQLLEGDENGKNFYLRLADSEFDSLESNPGYKKNTGNKRQLWIIATLTISLTVVALSFVMLCFSVVAVTDSISQGRVVTRSDTIVSAGKVFELGFFTIGNSSNYYVGIWYKQISVRTIVWVANRDLPLTSSSPALTINNEGNLVIVDGRITYEVSDNALSQNTSAILLDSGNFVLRNENFDVLWKSFDYPSDTLLPGMKLGYSIKNKKLWSIRSWRDVDDPEVGAAELKMDPKRPKELFLIRNSELAWQSDGAWREGRFNLMPEMISNHTFNYSFYTNENEAYFIYFLYNSSIPSRFLIDVSGQLKQLLWLEKNQIWGLFWAQPRYECDIYSYCGPFSSCSNYTESFCRCLDGFIPSENWKQKDQSGGCVRRIPLRCEDSSDNSGEDRFLRIDDVKFPLSPKTSRVHAAEECKLACFNSCSCNAYAYNGSGVCYLWDAELLNLEQLSDGHPDGQTIYLKLAASEFLNPGGNKQLIWIVAVIVPLAVLLPASYIFCRWRTKRKAKEEIEISQDMLLFDMNMSVETSTSELSIGDGAGKGKSKDSWFPLFSLASVSAATDNFSAENKLGEGGFGPVYKGNLLNGQEVAVKRLSRQSGQGLEELKNETMLIAKLQHRNLVWFRNGHCVKSLPPSIVMVTAYPVCNSSLLDAAFISGKLSFGEETRLQSPLRQHENYSKQYDIACLSSVIILNTIVNGEPLFLLFFLFFLSIELILAADTITPTRFIRDGETLVSSRESFELAFFSPVNSTKRTVENPVAKLLDSGNLVLTDNFSTGSESYLWQSFDYPLDTLLPGMKLGWGLKTGVERYLTSWKSADDPSYGDFTFRLDIHVSPQVFIYNGSTKVSRSGPWNGVSLEEFLKAQTLILS
ncbi:hypothetical protein LWI28_009777 [Acer negundo]|uniref:Uncharacterized protein n=1 Tax=Acer negundo TaxID=4023 RepID=A0AAD5J413_ACENE|nr:hypothetical protein LWI28_009777 [Acer negundo]